MSATDPRTGEALPTLAVVSAASEGGQKQDAEGDVDEGGTELLSPRETIFADALASGSSLGDAAKAVGISSRSGRRWRKKPEIAEAVRARLTENVSMARAILSAGASKAAIGLVDMSSGDAEAEAARVSACRGVLETTLKLTELEELQTELAALKAQVEAMVGSRPNPSFGRM